MNKEIYEKEIGICRDQSKDSGGCNWGRCEDCGVVPLLHKLYKGELVEIEEDVKNLKNNLLNN